MRKEGGERKMGAEEGYKEGEGGGRKKEKEEGKGGGRKKEREKAMTSNLSNPSYNRCWRS